MTVLDEFWVFDDLIVAIQSNAGSGESRARA